jgi:N12 class adenine-specific DNA methylase
VPRGEVSRVRANLRAIQLARFMEVQKRHATPAEKRLLAAYTGWGGTKEAFNELYGNLDPANWRYDSDAAKRWRENWGDLYGELRRMLKAEEWKTAAESTLNAHYTSAEVAGLMWKMAEQMGFKGGNVLEPSAGAGIFLTVMPPHLARKSRVTAIEMDNLTGRILRQLHPEANVLIEGFEKAKLRRDDSLPLRFNLHNYFFAKTFQYLKPGRVLLYITSAYSMDSIKKEQRAQRQAIAQQSELLAAYRLPCTAFKENAHTEVVTDLLVLRKPDGRKVGSEPWMSVEKFVGKEFYYGEPPSRYINEYYWRHPDHVLGKHSFQGSMYRNDEYTVTADPDRPFLQALEELIPRLPLNLFESKETQPEVIELENRKRASKAAKEFSYQLDESGNVRQVVDGFLAPIGWARELGTRSGQEKDEIASAFVGLREALKLLINTELDPAKTDSEVEGNRTKLKSQYDQFVLQHGHLNALKSKLKFLAADPEYDAVLALENAKDIFLDGKKARECLPAPILSQRTLRPTIRPESAESVEDAFVISMGYRNAVDLSLMGKLLTRENDPDGIREELVARGLAFEDPASGEILPAAKYLSGNLRNKLKVARTANEHEMAVTGYARYQKNVQALEPLVPREKVMGEFKVKLGATWVAPDIYQKFAESLLGGSVDIRYRKADDRFSVDPDGCKYSSQNLNDYGYSGRRGDEILELILNQQPLVHEDTIKKPDGSYTRVYNAEKTALLRQSVSRMVEQWESHITSQAEIAHRLTRLYNELFNSHRAPVYDGSYLPLPGLSGAVRRTMHQMNAVARNLQERGGLLAHDVGYGKTFTKIMTCMELRRLGLARKPMIVVQNSTLGQYAASFRTAYPQANILVASDNNFDKQNRRRCVAAIATHDWDAIIIAQSQFDLLPNSVQMIKKFSANQLEAYKEVLLDAEVSGDRIQAKRARHALISFERKIEKQIEDLTKRQDNMLAFDQLGVDFLFVDEIHAYKKIPYATKLGRIKGVDMTVSQRGLNLAMKAKWLHDANDGRNVIGATGTPVSNTLAEAWNMHRLTNPKLLEEFGVETFDRFASVFCMQKTAPELNESTNTWRIVTRMSEFVNGDGLRSLIRSGWDVQMDPVAINLKLPKLRGGKPISVTMPATAPAEEIMNRIAEAYYRWEEMDPQDRLAYSYVPLVLMQYGLAGSLDPRLADPALPDDPKSLVNKAVEQIVKEYHAHAKNRAAQLVFADSYRPISLKSLDGLMDVTIESGDGRVDGEEGEDEEEGSERQAEPLDPRASFNLYHDIRRKLLKAGIPAAEIAIIGDYSSKAQKKELFDSVNSGNIRVLLGSTSKMGIGVNVQERLVAIHELAPPRDMTPASSRQRRGRIERQGNTFEEIAVYQYGMENTTVAGVFHRIERKEKSVVQILMGYDESQSFEDPASELLRSSAELKALCARDERVLRKVELEEQIRTMAAERNGFAQKKFRDQETLERYKHHRSWLEDFNERLRAGILDIQEAFQKKYERSAPLEISPQQSILPGGESAEVDSELRTDGNQQKDDETLMELRDEKGGVLVVDRQELFNALEALLQKAIDRNKAHGILDRGVAFTLNAIPMRVKLESISTCRNDAKFSLETYRPNQIIRSGDEINKTTITSPRGIVRSFRSLPDHFARSLSENQTEIERLDKNMLTLQRIISETPAEWPKQAQYSTLSQELAEIDSVLTQQAIKRKEERRQKRQAACPDHTTPENPQRASGDNTAIPGYQKQTGPNIDAEDGEDEELNDLLTASQRSGISI